MSSGTPRGWYSSVGSNGSFPSATSRSFHASISERRIAWCRSLTNPSPPLGEPVERGRGRPADRDVVRVAGDAVGTERDHYVGPLLVEDRRDPIDQPFERLVGDTAVRVPEPLVAVRLAPERDPRPAIFLLAHDAEGLPRGAAPLRDLPGGAVRRVDQDEPERRIVGVQRDGAGATERVVIGMRDDHGEAANHGTKGTRASGQQRVQADREAGPGRDGADREQHAGQVTGRGRTCHDGSRGSARARRRSFRGARARPADGRCAPGSPRRRRRARPDARRRRPERAARRCARRRSGRRSRSPSRWGRPPCPRGAARSPRRRRSAAAASAANRSRSAAPSAKFEATIAFAAPPSAIIRICSSPSGPMPVVPITACTPRSRQDRAFSSTASGRVKSTATSPACSACASATTGTPSTREPA